MSIGTIEIIGSPEMINRARPSGVQPQPWLPLATPMQQTDRPRMKTPAPAFKVITSQPMLVPPVIHTLQIPSQNQKKRRQRTQVVDPLLLLHRHPCLHLRPVLPLPPFLHVHHHHPRVEIARFPSLERLIQLLVLPEQIREIQHEIRLAILRRRQHLPLQVNLPQLRNVIHNHDIRVQVYHAFHVTCM